MNFSVTQISIQNYTKFTFIFLTFEEKLVGIHEMGNFYHFMQNLTMQTYLTELM